MREHPGTRWMPDELRADPRARGASRPLSAVHAAELGDAEALADQRTGVTLMWVSGMAVVVPMVVGALWRWASREQRAAEQRERPAQTA